MTKLNKRNGSLMKLNQALIAIILCLCSLQATAIHLSPKKDRWFEIEVILFSQLGDKSLLKENFDTPVALPAYKKSIDLLTPYLQPDIAHLKSLLPYCDSVSYPLNQTFTFNNTKPLPKLFTHKTLIELAAEQTQEAANIVNIHAENKNVNEAPLYSNGELSDVSADVSDDFYNDDTSSKQQLENETQAQSTITPPNSIVENDIPLSEETIALAKEAEEYFIPLENKKINLHATDTLCVWSQGYFEKHLNTQDTLLSYNELPVAKMPENINGIETPYSEKPYLINQDSLKLQDIVKQLSLSKNFKPLLHMGWRQHTLNKKKAIPVKLFAGDNLKSFYAEQKQMFEDKLKELETDAALLQSDVKNGLDDASNNEKTNTEAIEEAQRSQKIKAILASLDQAPTDINDIISTESNNLSSILNSEDSTQLALPIAPIAPEQPWFLNGFIKVHVMHYLHVTADFNIMSSTLSEQNKAQSRNPPLLVKPINFKQDRRVISGELHYFDHPYMGMIVQIRRYQKPEIEHTHEPEMSMHTTH